MGLFHIIAMIIVGFIVGFIAEVLYPGAQHLGFWKAAIIGIVGSLVGGVIGGLVFRSPDGKFHPAGWFLSIIGALLVLWVYLNYLQ
ncbi:MAG: GlsB/YeaQ/YmgE family stress response membrane protein [Casimicrobiaceae bacterium]